MPVGPPKRKRPKVVTSRNKPTDPSGPSSHRRKMQLAESSDSEEAPSPKRQATSQVPGQETEAELRAKDLAEAQAKVNQLRADAERERQARQAAKAASSLTDSLKVSNLEPPRRARTRFKYGPPFKSPHYIPSSPQSGVSQPPPGSAASPSAAIASPTAMAPAARAPSADAPAAAPHQTEESSRSGSVEQDTAPSSSSAPEAKRQRAMLIDRAPR